MLRTGGRTTVAQPGRAAAISAITPSSTPSSVTSTCGPSHSSSVASARSAPPTSVASVYAGEPSTACSCARHALVEPDERLRRRLRRVALQEELPCGVAGRAPAGRRPRAARPRPRRARRRRRPRSLPRRPRFPPLRTGSSPPGHPWPATPAPSPSSRSRGSPGRAGARGRGGTPPPTGPLPRARRRGPGRRSGIAAVLRPAISRRASGTRSSTRGQMCVTSRRIAVWVGGQEPAPTRPATGGPSSGAGS